MEDFAPNSSRKQQMETQAKVEFGRVPSRQSFQQDIALAGSYEPPLLCLRGISGLFTARHAEGRRAGLAWPDPSRTVKSGGIKEGPAGTRQVGHFPLSIRRAKSHRYVRYEARRAGSVSRAAQTHSV